VLITDSRKATKEVQRPFFYWKEGRRKKDLKALPTPDSFYKRGRPGCQGREKAKRLQKRKMRKKGEGIKPGYEKMREGRKTGIGNPGR